MLTNQETVALERPQDQFLAFIEKVIDNPAVDAEKLKVLVDLQIQLEDRKAEKEFDAAMIEAQREVKALAWDKVNFEKNSRHVSYPKIDEMLQPIRERFGFAENFGVEPEMPAPNQMMMYADVIHQSPCGTHRRRYHLPMPIDGQGPKGGGVMTGPQAVGNGTSYGMRYLDKMIWKIPMLVDRDDNDGNEIQGKRPRGNGGKDHRFGNQPREKASSRREESPGEKAQLETAEEGKGISVRQAEDYKKALKSAFKGYGEDAAKVGWGEFQKRFPQIKSLRDIPNTPEAQKIVLSWLADPQHN